MTPSPLDFPPINGLGQSSIMYHSEPFVNKTNVELTITKIFVLTDVGANKHHEVLSVKSDYVVPINLLKSREDIFSIYTDAAQGLNEAYQYVRDQMPELPNLHFPSQPIESYKKEIDRVFSLLSSQN